MEEFRKEIKALRSELWGFDGCYLAGGAITSKFTGEPVRDYDLYFQSRDKFLGALETMYEEGMWCISITDRAATFANSNGGCVVQLMCFSWFPDAEAIFKKFDFTCNMAAIDLKTGEFFHDKRFLPGIAQRDLRFNWGTEYPLASAMRVRKYAKRGYGIEDSEYLKVVIACAFKDIQSWGELQKQIGGQYSQAMLIDTSAEFNVENVVTALDNALSKELEYEKHAASDFAEAVEFIFGKDEAETILKERETVAQ